MIIISSQMLTIQDSSSFSNKESYSFFQHSCSLLPWKFLFVIKWGEKLLLLRKGNRWQLGKLQDVEKIIVLDYDMYNQLISRRIREIGVSELKSHKITADEVPCYPACRDYPFRRSNSVYEDWLFWYWPRKSLSWESDFGDLLWYAAFDS